MMPIYRHSYQYQPIMVASEGQGLSLTNVLHSISDSKSLELFCSIAKGSVDSEVLKGLNGLTRKQFYSRMSQLLKAGLIKRTKGIFSLTCLGAVVYYSQLVIEKGTSNYWKLKAIDTIKTSAQIGEHERTKLIKAILDDGKIENILITEKQ